MARGAASQTSLRNEALVVGEDWISQHYFSTTSRKQSFMQRVLERRKVWDESEVGTTRSRFTSRRSELETLFVAAHEAEGQEARREATSTLHTALMEVLGYRGGQFLVESEGPVTTVRQQHLPDGPSLAVLQALPVETLEELLDRKSPTLLTPWEREGEEPVESVATALSTLLTDAHGPEFALVLSGRWCLVAERERWPEGRWLAVDLQLVAERADRTKGGETDRALVVVDAESLAPDAEGSIWWTTTLEESVKHTVGVSADLQEGVRDSVELIANEVVARRRAQGLPPLPADQAQPLATQSLRFLYRVLFLLYAEASPELGVLPVGAEEYDAGYGLDRLRDLVLVDLHQERSRSGTHLYDSLELLFRAVDQGHAHQGGSTAERDGLVFQPLRADLFKPEAVVHIAEVKLGNATLLQVLRKLLLSKEGLGERGFISYVDLGINQLGAVYEGLMSYSGFFAETDLYEVAKNGDRTDGSWVVPVDRSEHIPPEHFVTRTNDVGEAVRVLYRPGEFVYRLSGRDRQRSASYYTPEVLTRFTVQQALEELLDQDGHTTTAEEILGLTVCEPALGSGAFAIEAVRQLAEEYLRRREVEVGDRVDPDQRPQELQRVKAHIALHQVHGVDLNATAVELAEISLWLDTMVAGLQAPWFGLRLRQGNSLIGARREFYGSHQLAKKAWLSTAPAPEPLQVLVERAEKREAPPEGSRIAHFLLPAAGWGSATEAPKAVRDLMDAGDLKGLKDWRRHMKTAPTKSQAQRLVALTARVEDLWFLALRRLEIAQRESSRALDLWGRETPAESHAVSREQIEEALADENGAYRRLRRVMDAWCALWFWPVDSPAAPPTLEEWISACEGLLGVAPARAASRGRYGHTQGQGSFADIRDWQELDGAESVRLVETHVRRVDDVVASHPWLDVCGEIAATQAFFHWELDFAAVFAQGGFDLQVGNPPWVRPDVSLATEMGEFFPGWSLYAAGRETSADLNNTFISLARSDRRAMLARLSETAALKEFVSAASVWKIGLGRSDLYRCFMIRSWDNQAPSGVVALIHSDSHFTDANTGNLRRAAYKRTRRHWHFVNELRLFAIQNQQEYPVNVYGAPVASPSFLSASYLYHPSVVEASLRHDGTGSIPGIKDLKGNWDLRPHRSRITTVDMPTLEAWSVAKGGGDPREAVMIYSVTREFMKYIEVAGRVPTAGSWNLRFSSGWNQTTDRRKGVFREEWGQKAFADSILQGTHIFVSTPYVRVPNATMRTQNDWREVDLEALPADYIPETSFARVIDSIHYKSLYTTWRMEDGEVTSALDHVRVAWRSQIDNAGQRTFTPTLLPPGISHVGGILSVGAPGRSNFDIAYMQGVFSSILVDSLVRASPKTNATAETVSRLPLPRVRRPLADWLVHRSLRLNCLTSHYSGVWGDAWTAHMDHDVAVLGEQEWVRGAGEWAEQFPLRGALARRNAQVEMEAIVSLLMGVSADLWADVYNSQFPVMRSYDDATGRRKKFVFDANGRMVPPSLYAAWRDGGQLESSDAAVRHPDSGIEYVYEPPFSPRDREADFRTAYAEFERRLAAAEAACPAEETGR